MFGSEASLDAGPGAAHHRIALAERKRMKRTRWLFVAAAMAGVVVLVVPAVGQGKAQFGSLSWSRSRGGPTITSYDVGAFDGGGSVSRSFRLGSSSPTKSAKLAISLTGAPAFSITSDKCTRKRIGRKLSCWVSVAYRPIGPPASDRATLRATGFRGTAASLSLSGSNLGPYGHVYWVDFCGGGAVSEVPLSGGRTATLAHANPAGSEEGYGSVAVAVDSKNVYWITGGPRGTVDEIPLRGGSVTNLASDQGFPVSVAVNGTYN